MKIFAIRIFFVLLICTIFSSIQTISMFTPELFGNGTAYVIRIDNNIYGYTRAWGGWVVYGELDDCRIAQIYGERIDHRDGTNNPIPYSMSFKNEKSFSGWIDFRGHNRKFCSQDMIAKCFYKE